MSQWAACCYAGSHTSDFSNGLSGLDPVDRGRRRDRTFCRLSADQWAMLGRVEDREYDIALGMLERRMDRDQLRESTVRQAVADILRGRDRHAPNHRSLVRLDRTPVLTRRLDDYLREEAEALPDAVWVPLGGKAEAGVQYLIRKGHIDPARVLTGLLHLSGANAERVAYFVGRKARADLSAKTPPDGIDAARERLMGLVSGLSAV